MIINVLTNNSCPNSRAFNFPILLARNILLKKGYKVNFSFTKNPQPKNADILFVNSNVFRPFWGKDKHKIFSFLEQSAKKNQKILWFDTTDSTWCTQFEVMPYVNLFLKSQVFRDKMQYLKRFRTGRIFTDYFDVLYNSNEKEENFPIPSEVELRKIGISWNTCFENYNESRFGLTARLLQKTRPWLSSVFCDEGLAISFTSPNSHRSKQISCRIGLSHSRPSVVSHRKSIIKIMNEMGVGTSKLTLPEYFSELRNSQIGIGPFGVGEITLRDYEIIICGATLVKPDMSHLETWPDLFNTKNILFFKWDLSDFDKKLDLLLNDSEMRIELATNAQKTYRQHLSQEGIVEFSERLIKIISQMP